MAPSPRAVSFLPPEMPSTPFAPGNAPGLVGGGSRPSAFSYLALSGARLLRPGLGRRGGLWQVRGISFAGPVPSGGAG